jgi:predicted kinase
VLRFYQVYRAMVRAKVIAIRMQQPTADHRRDTRSCIATWSWQTATTAPLRPRLLITHGLSGSGKTALGHRLREHLPLIQIRSDIERKRLFDLAASLQPAPPPCRHLHQRGDARTYNRLMSLADAVLASGYSVMLDATFLRRHQREAARALAERHRCSFTILALHAPPAAARADSYPARRGADASEADRISSSPDRPARAPRPEEQAALRPPGHPSKRLRRCPDASSRTRLTDVVPTSSGRDRRDPRRTGHRTIPRALAHWRGTRATEWVRCAMLRTLSSHPRLSSHAKTKQRAFPNGVARVIEDVYGKSANGTLDAALSERLTPLLDELLLRIAADQGH